ncbi:MAG: DUF3553 domain-containing protein [Acetobacteraceae bacterium]
MSSGAGSSFAPGQFVRHPERPDWGVGQVQSAIGSRVTVNFEHAGKVTVNVAVVHLEALPEHDLDSASAGPRSPLTR